MNTKHAFVLFSAGALPVVAYAQVEDVIISRSGSPLVAVLWTVLPILVVAAAVWWIFIRRLVRNNQKRTDDYIADQKRHNERVEHLLERVANDIEKKDAKGG
jgi:TRAP-type C4-dicarboxylate transport system permease small subunit